MLLGRIEEAAENVDKAATLIDDLSDGELAAKVDAINRLGWAEFYLERFERSIAHLRRGVAVSRATGQSQFIPYMQQGWALSEMTLGNRAVADELSENAIESAQLMNIEYVLGAALCSRGGTALMSGDLETVIRAAKQALPMLAQLEGSHVLGLAGGGLAAASVEAGDLGADIDTYFTAAGGPEMPMVTANFRVQFQEVMTRGWLAAGELAQAEECAARSEAEAEKLSLPVALAMGRRARAGILLAMGKAEAAAELALASAQGAAAAGARIEAARSRLLAGRALAEAGDRDAALRALREAEPELEACAAERPREEVRRELRRLGARIEPRGPAADGDGLASLSKREREVGDLVTERKTNKQIAAELFLSEKTVESHLRNIFFKLGVSSRVEVARSIEREAANLSD